MVGKIGKYFYLKLYLGIVSILMVIIIVRLVFNVIFLIFLNVNLIFKVSYDVLF